MTPGVPAKPMAARICEGVDDGLRLLGVPQCGPFLVEYKYDGVRAQIHLLPDGQVRDKIQGAQGISGEPRDVRG